MPLRMSGSNSADELYKRYRELTEHVPEPTKEAGRKMLELLPKLEELCKDREVWAMTSHATLCLQSREDFRSRLHVAVTPGTNQIWVHYTMRPEAAPWPGAEVHGWVREVDEAVACIEKAMELSGGWSSDEPRLEEQWRAWRRSP